MKKQNFILNSILLCIYITFLYYSIICFYLPIIKVESDITRDLPFVVILSIIFLFSQKVVKYEETKNSGFENMKMPRSSAESKERLK